MRARDLGNGDGKEIAVTKGGESVVINGVMASRRRGKSDGVELFGDVRRVEEFFGTVVRGGRIGLGDFRNRSRTCLHLHKLAAP